MAQHLKKNRFVYLGAALQACLLVYALMLSGLARADGIQPALIEPKVGSRYYTRYSFKEEKKKHNTTNYWRGNLVPLNSLVTLVSLGKKKMVIELEDGRKITFVNVSKFTKRRIPEIASELLAPSSIPLDKLKKAHRLAIETGELKLGMSKNEVIMARGYPPRHKTPSTDNDIWTYWSSKFVKRSLVFDDGILTEGRGIR